MSVQSLRGRIEALETSGPKNIELARTAIAMARQRAGFSEATADELATYAASSPTQRQRAVAAAFPSSRADARRILAARTPHA